MFCVKFFKNWLVGFGEGDKKFIKIMIMMIDSGYILIRKVYLGFLCK